MKKFTFFLVTVLFVCSICANAQKSSKVTYNTESSSNLSDELKAKLKAKGITQENYMKQKSETSIQQQENWQQKEQTQVKPQIKTIDKSNLKLNKQKNQSIKVKKHVIEKKNLADKAKQMNIDFANKGLQYKTQIKTIGGKQYIEIVDLPQQNGMTPATNQ